MREKVPLAMSEEEMPICPTYFETATAAPDHANLSSGTQPVNDFAQPLAFYISGHITFAVIVKGLITNAMIIGALNTHVNPKPSICNYLIALALWDILLLVTSATMTAVPNVFYGGQTKATVLLPYYPYLIFPSSVTVVGNVWTLMLLAIERSRALRNPFGHFARHPFRLTQIIAITGFTGVFYAWPRLFELELYKCITGNNGIVKYSLEPTKLRENNLYVVGHRLIGGLLMYSLCPYVVILALTIAISRTLRANTDTIARLTARSRGHRAQPQLNANAIKRPNTVSDLLDSSNRMLMWVNVKYLITQLPTTILDAIEIGISVDSFIASELVANLIALSNLLVTLNSATNFWVYFASSSFFRKAVMRLLHGHCHQEKYTLLAAGYQIRLLAQDQAQGMIAYRCRLQSSHASRLDQPKAGKKSRPKQELSSEGVSHRLGVPGQQEDRDRQPSITAGLGARIRMKIKRHTLIGNEQDRADTNSGRGSVGSGKPLLLDKTDNRRRQKSLLTMDTSAYPRYTTIIDFRNDRSRSPCGTNAPATVQLARAAHDLSAPMTHRMGNRSSSEENMDAITQRCEALSSDSTFCIEKRSPNDKSHRLSGAGSAALNSRPQLQQQGSRLLLMKPRVSVPNVIASFQQTESLTTSSSTHQPLAPKKSVYLPGVTVSYVAVNSLASSTASINTPPQHAPTTKAVTNRPYIGSSGSSSDVSHQNADHDDRQQLQPSSPAKHVNGSASQTCLVLTNQNGAQVVLMADTDESRDGGVCTEV